MIRMTHNYSNGDVVTIEVNEDDSKHLINKMFAQAHREQEEKYATHTPYCTMSSILDAFDEYSSSNRWN